MKPIFRLSWEKKPPCLFSSLLLLLGLPLSPAIAVPFSPALTIDYLAQAPELPPADVVEAVRRELARRSEIPQAKLSLIAAMRERWSDGCLGLAKPDELCTQALVEGWRLIISHEQQTWVYRTDATGQQIRLEKSR